jgi:hypothetical protein
MGMMKRREVSGGGTIWIWSAAVAKASRPSLGEAAAGAHSQTPAAASVELIRNALGEMRMDGQG